MFRTFRNFALAVFLVRWLKPRWKRLLGGLGIFVLAVYGHGEYLSYLRVLPDEQAAREPVWMSFLIKYLFFLVAGSMVVIPEFRNRTHSEQTGADPESDRPSDPGGTGGKPGEHARESGTENEFDVFLDGRDVRTGPEQSLRTHSEQTGADPESDRPSDPGGTGGKPGEHARESGTENEFDVFLDGRDVRTGPEQSLRTHSEQTGADPEDDRPCDPGATEGKLGEHATESGTESEFDVFLDGRDVRTGPEQSLGREA